MICCAAVSVLLILLWSPVEVHFQTGPYLTFMGQTLPNHSYVDLSVLGELDNEDDHVVCHTNLASCCAGVVTDRDYWYFPDGAVLPEAAGDPHGAADNPIVMWRLNTQRVSLIRGTGPGDAPYGIYHCIIETNAVNGQNNSPDGITGGTLYVGVYSTGGYK